MMNPLGWPGKVWQPGEITSSGKQLWFSSTVTAEDRKRRQDYEDNFMRREAERLEDRL